MEKLTQNSWSPSIPIPIKNSSTKHLKRNSGNFQVLTGKNMTTKNSNEKYIYKTYNMIFIFVFFRIMLFHGVWRSFSLTRRQLLFCYIIFDISLPDCSCYPSANLHLHYLFFLSSSILPNSHLFQISHRFHTVHHIY